jgi:flagellar P-ring protein precursor FlgI
MANRIQQSAISVQPRGRRVGMARLAVLAGLVSLGFLVPGLASATEVRVKDVAKIQGVRDNELFGYGLVIGLNGTGDKAGTQFTVQSITSMLQRMGIQVPRDRIGVKNVAAVIVTAKLLPFAKAGSTTDVVVSSLGDASSLQGGLLLLTPLQAADGNVYAVAQGPVSLGGFRADSGGGDKVQKNHPTVGRIPNGAIIEKEVPTTVVENQTVAIVLNNPDFTTAGRLAETIGRTLGKGRARAEDAATVRVAVEPGQDVIGLIGTLEHLRLTPDRIAKVVVNERTGTIIMGSEVRISTVAIAHGNLTVQVKTDLQVSQPAPFSQRGTTAVVPQRSVAVQEDKRNLSVIEEGASIGDLVQALNALGVTSRDLIAILQAIKQSGALQAELEII